MAQQPAPKQQKKPPYYDNSDLPEVFADDFHSLQFGNGVATMTLAVTRSEEGDPPKQRRVPAARVVMPLPLALEVYRQLGAMVQMMQQQGLITATPANGQTTTPPIPAL